MIEHALLEANFKLIQNRTTIKSYTYIYYLYQKS